MASVNYNPSKIRGKTKVQKNPSPSKGEALYETFHGKKPSKVRKIDKPDIRESVVLGRAVAIEYECTKLNGVKDSRKGKKNVFRHEMPNGNILTTNESGSLLMIRGKNLSVKRSGINN